MDYVRRCQRAKWLALALTGKPTPSLSYAGVTAMLRAGMAAGIVLIYSGSLTTGGKSATLASR